MVEQVQNHLTLRKREILQLLAEENTNKDAATQLTISVKAVETHRAKHDENLNCHQ